MFQRTLLSTLLTSGCVVCLLLVQNASSEHAQAPNECAAHPTCAEEDTRPHVLARIQMLLDTQPRIPFGELAREAHLLAELSDGPGQAPASDRPATAGHGQLRRTSLQLAAAAEEEDERRCAILVGERALAHQRCKPEHPKPHAQYPGAH
jgi:hypothetical protein